MYRSVCLSLHICILDTPKFSAIWVWFWPWISISRICGILLATRLLVATNFWVGVTSCNVILFIGVCVNGIRFGVTQKWVSLAIQGFINK